MRRLWILLLMVMSISCLAQIPTQFYLANDSCNFVLPDYSQAVQVLDNCCVDSNGFYQTPHSGTLLFPGYDITVTLVGRDCAGNSVQMTFDVVVIDEVPPTFFYDSTQFLPMGMYQNEDRIFKLYITLDSSNLDNNGNPDYLTYYRDPNHGHQPIAANIYDTNPELVSYLDHPDDWRGTIFRAEGNFDLTNVRLKLYRTGYDPYQEVIVEIMEVVGDQNPSMIPLSQGRKLSKELFTDSTGEGAWYTIPMRKMTLYHGQEYVIVTRINRGDFDNKIQWRINTESYSGGFLVFTNNGSGEEGLWQRNHNRDYMFEIWGHKI
jgi:hypothetical protein